MYPTQFRKTLMATTSASFSSIDQAARSAHATGLWSHKATNRYTTQPLRTSEIAGFMYGFGAAELPTQTGAAAMQCMGLRATEAGYRGHQTAGDALIDILSTPPNDVREIIVFRNGPSVLIRCDDGSEHLYGARTRSSGVAFCWSGATLDAIALDLQGPAPGGWSAERVAA